MKDQVPRWADSRLFLLYIWLCLGFGFGTLFLLFPVRWWVTITRDNHYSNGTEKNGVIFLIIVLIVFSFWLSRKWFYAQLNQKTMFFTLFTAIAPTLMALTALVVFLHPRLVNNGGEKSQISYRFAIGPYPDEEKIKSLKAEGYTGIISLLHPAVVPFEPVLLEEEAEIAAKYHIELIKAPMLPWVSNNSTSLKIIADLMKKPSGRYYIHCYLGKDRVNLVRKMIESNLGKTALKSDIRTSRTFEEMGYFERGEIFKLAPGIYYTPYPTKEEFLAFFLAGNVKSVVNLMDPANHEHQQRIKEEHQLLTSNKIIFKNFALNTQSANIKSISKQIVDSVLALPKPVVVHHWNSRCPETMLFLHEFANVTGQQPVNLDHSHAPRN